MEIEKSVKLLFGGLGLCGAAYMLGPVALGATAGKVVVGAAGGLAGHFAADICKWFAERYEKLHPDKDKLTKNHDLRELVTQSIETVLARVIESGAGGTDGAKLLRQCTADVRAHLVDAAINPRFEAIWDQSITEYFKSTVEEFSSVKALTPEAWVYFLQPDYDTVVAKQHKLNLDQLAALQAAATGLYDDLPKTLVGIYRHAFENDPTVFVAVMTEILKEIWNSVSRVENKLDKATQSILGEIQTLTVALGKAHPAAMRTYVNEFAATAGAFHMVLDDMMVWIRKTHDDVVKIGEDLKDLKVLVNEVHTRQSNSGTRAGSVLTQEEIKQKIKPYLEWLINRTKIIELRGIKHGDTPVIQLYLKDAYVPLQATRLQDAESAWTTHDPHQLLHRIRSRQQHAKVDVDVPMEKVLGEGTRLAITGGAGSGKTTVLRYIAWRLATALAGGQTLPDGARLGLAAEVPLPVPILVSFVSFARYLRDLPGHAPGNLESFLSHDLVHNEATFELAPDFLRQLLNEGRDVILLLDGLDEVADQHEREKMRDWVSNFARDRQALRVVATCRTVAYRNDAALADFKKIAVQPLDMEKHIAPMVRQAYACINVDQREARIAQLLSGIEQLEEIRRASPGYDGKALVDSPLMVRLMLIVQMNNHELPDERADLFDKAVDALFQVEYGVDVDNKKEIARNWERYRDMAQRLAFHLHEKGKDQGREIEEPALKAVLREEQDFKPHIGDFLRLVRLRGGWWKSAAANSSSCITRFRNFWSRVTCAK